MFRDGLITKADYEFARQHGFLPNEEHADSNFSMDGACDRRIEVEKSPMFHHKITIPRIPSESSRSTYLNSGHAKLNELTRQLQSEKHNRRPDLSGDSLFAGVSGGEPVYYKSHSVDAAFLNKTYDLWPLAGTNYGLSGSNTVLGLFDHGCVHVNHEEFTNGCPRVFQVSYEISSNEWEHPTEMAGFMVASGVNTNARGMSYAAILHAYNFYDSPFYGYWFRDVVDMANASSSNEFQVSANPYGTLCGWTTFLYNGDLEWFWLGDMVISTYEDYKYGFYDSNTTRRIDEIVYNAKTYLPVFSTGDDRRINKSPPYQPITHAVRIGSVTGWISNIHAVYTNRIDCLSPQAVAKNVLTVGAALGNTNISQSVVWSNSSIGPTDDWRIKPDIVAHGVSVTSVFYNEGSPLKYSSTSGSSVSAAITAGSLNLLVELYQKLWGTNSRPLSSTLKALAIHTACDIYIPGPDILSGWGMLDTEAAAHMLLTDNESGISAHIKEFSLPNGGAINFMIQSTTNPLKLTMVWTDPPGPCQVPALNPTNLMLVNDLDLRVISSSGNTNYPFCLSTTNALITYHGDNIRDNVEQVMIPVPANDEYRVTINHKGVLSNGIQDVSLILSGNDPSVFSNDTEIVEYYRVDGSNLMRWVSNPGVYYQIQTKTNLMIAGWAPSEALVSSLSTTVLYNTGSDLTNELKFYRVVVDH
ncbi:MAG: S8 family serine peptidase [Kiritimatiellae bacterium]|nr:S8 family serine peptidase [Kiritimatiellia bacterium]